jgi:hypothetical protein
MNHTCKTLFNRALGLWQAVSELASSQGKTRSVAAPGYGVSVGAPLVGALIGRCAKTRAPTRGAPTAIALAVLCALTFATPAFAQVTVGSGQTLTAASDADIGPAGSSIIFNGGTLTTTYAPAI